MDNINAYIGLAVIIFCLAWAVGIVLNAMIAYQKGRNIFWAIAVSIFFTPLTSYLYLLAVPALNIEKTENKNVAASKPASVWKNDN